MESTYPHYHVPASLPSDYALLSRYTQASRTRNEINENEGQSDSEDDESTLEGPSDRVPFNGTRRASLPASYRRPTKPTIGNHMAPPSLRPNEVTPLLNPPFPRIVEHVERSDSDPDESRMKMFWEELRIITKYTLPVFGTHLLEYSLVTASVLSIGHLSTTALAAITLGSMTASVSGLSVIQGLTSALDTMLPSAWTSSQPQLVGLWSQRMFIVISACLIPILLVWLNAEGILLSLKQDPDVARLAAVYLRWIALGLPAYAFNGVSRRYFQSQGLFAVPTRIIFIVAPINAVLNFLLVWGPQPIRLGFIGAPIATAISFNLVSLMSIVYGIFYVPRTAWHPICRRSFTSLGVLVQLGLAGVAQTASEWWAWELVALAASLIGPVALATQSVLLVSASTTFQFPFALSVAASVRIGNLLGEKKAVRAGVSANTAIVIAICFSGLTSTMFLVFRNSWAYLFNGDPAVVSLVASILPLVALFQVFDGVSAVTAGILRAMGKQVVGALLNLSAYYIIGIPFGIWLAFSWSLGIHGLWIGLTVSLVYCAVIGTYICVSTNWEKEVTKVTARLAKEDKDNERDRQASISAA